MAKNHLTLHNFGFTVVALFVSGKFNCSVLRWMQRGKQDAKTRVVPGSLCSRRGLRSIGNLVSENSGTSDWFDNGRAKGAIEKREEESEG